MLPKVPREETALYYDHANVAKGTSCRDFALY